jgi:coenzyme Q-binding protein COQ10
MTSFSAHRQVDYAATDMFALVCDVEAYPQFVPLCEGMRVVSRSPSGEGVEIIVAEMEVGFKAICERFTSRVTCNAQRLEVLVEYTDGPFKKFETRWAFHEEPKGPGEAPGSVIDFYISYEFRSLALGVLMGAMFDKAFQKYADTFIKRAGEVYGRR